MKRVGIITFHRAANYGAVLQAYALQKKMNEMGCEAEIIDYECPLIDDLYRAICYKPESSIIRNIKNICLAPFIQLRNNRFLKFREKYVKESDTTYNSSTINLTNDKYDIFITGSDMVWHWHEKNGKKILDPNYFLKFVNDNTKRNSYAASFAISEIPKELELSYRTLLGEFNNISVREKTGEKLVKDLTGAASITCLDPTLLLEKKEWMSLVGNKSSKDYILLYSLEGAHRTLEYAYRLSKKTALPVVQLMPGVTIKDALKKNHKISQGPLEFLQLFSGAKYVVTSTFHGTAFSILFHKPFVVDLHENKEFNNRAAELLIKVGLESRDIEKIGSIDDYISWDKVEMAINKYRDVSIEYLKSLIDN